MSWVCSGALTSHAMDIFSRSLQDSYRKKNNFQLGIESFLHFHNETILHESDHLGQHSKAPAPPAVNSSSYVLHAPASTAHPPPPTSLPRYTACKEGLPSPVLSAGPPHPQADGLTLTQPGVSWPRWPLPNSGQHSGPCPRTGPPGPSGTCALRSPLMPVHSGPASGGPERVFPTRSPSLLPPHHSLRIAPCPALSFLLEPILPAWVSSESPPAPPRRPYRQHVRCSPAEARSRPGPPPPAPPARTPLGLLNHGLREGRAPANLTRCP